MSEENMESREYEGPCGNTTMILGIRYFHGSQNPFVGDIVVIVEDGRPHPTSVSRELLARTEQGIIDSIDLENLAEELNKRTTSEYNLPGSLAAMLEARARYHAEKARAIGRVLETPKEDSANKQPDAER